MKNKDSKIFLDAVDELEKEKGIEKDKMFEAIEAALFAAYKKNYGDDKNAKVEIDRETGEVKIYTLKMVVEEVMNDKKEIALDDLNKLGIKAVLGDEIPIEEKCDEFRRNAIQNAKQIVIQRVREAERDIVYNKFKGKEDDIITGIIRRIDEKKNIYIDFSGVEAVLPMTEQSGADRYKLGNRIKVYVVEVTKSSKYPKIVISRKREGFLKKLFEFEIPEIEEGTIEIKSIAREAGSRAKIAVYSPNKEIDTVGACIGQKGMRIKNIVEELNGEKIDIVEWKEDKAEFISNALSPSKVKKVDMIEAEMTARVIVEPSQLSLAIGKNGQNARLAARLTGMRVDIKTDNSKVQEGKEKSDTEE